MPETAELRVPNRVSLGESVEIEVQANSEFKSGLGSTVDFTATFTTSSGETIGSGSATSPETQNVNISTSWRPTGEIRETEVTVTVELTYNKEDDGGGTETGQVSDSRTVELFETLGEETEIVSEGGTGNSSASTLNEFYETKTPFTIENIVYEPDAPETITNRSNASIIEFYYENPSVTVDSSARFVKHDIIGRRTLRQKVGKDPLEISISGVCFRETARQIDGLRYADSGTILADRFDGGSIDVSFASSTTDPLEEGSAIDFTEVNELFNFSLECTEVR